MQPNDRGICLECEPSWPKSNFAEIVGSGHHKNSVCVFSPTCKNVACLCPRSESKCNKPFSHHRKSCAFVSVDLMSIFVFTKSISVLLFCFLHLRAPVVAHLLLQTPFNIFVPPSPPRRSCFHKLIWFIVSTVAI